MSAGGPFALHPLGAMCATVDGPEVLSSSGVDGSPLWRQFHDYRVIAVETAAQQVVSLDEGGILRWWGFDGSLVNQTDIPGRCTALAAAIDGSAAVVRERDVVRVDPMGGLHPIQVPGATKLSFGPDQNSLGIGTQQGLFYAVDPNSGSAWGQVQLQGAVTGISWNARGYWLVATTNVVYLVSGDGSQVAQQVPVQGQIDGVDSSEDGGVLAVSIGVSGVVIIELQNCSVAGGIDVRGRRVVDVDFGPGLKLGVGLEGGDASIVDLTTGHVVNTMAHPGREHHVWQLSPAVNGGTLLGAVAWARGGGSPVASQVIVDDGEPKGMNWAYMVIGFVVMLFVCSGCCGIGAVVRSYVL